MFLTYIDEYGDTGTRLDDPNQPVFALVSALIPDQAWIQLETELINLSLEIQEVLKLEDTPRLHMVDLYQRKGNYREVAVEQSFSWIERVLALARAADVRYHARIVWKDNYLQELRNSPKASDREVAAKGQAPSDLYIGHLPHLLLDLDAYCEQIGERTLLFVDQHDRTSHLDNLAIYRAWRNVGVLKSIVEAPIQRDSRHHTLLAIPDFAGYVALGSELDEKRGKARPMLREWGINFIAPYIISTDASGVDPKRALSVANFYFSESDQELNFSRAITALKGSFAHLDE
jgi:hypothetical protein